MKTITHTYISKHQRLGTWNSGRSFGVVTIVRVALLLLAALYFVLPGVSHAQVTLSGTVYSDAGVTAQAVSKTISIAVGTSTPSVFSTTSVATTGAWSLIIPAGHAIATSTPILVWIDGDVTTRGEVLTKSSSSQSIFSITGLDIYKDRVIARHEASSGTSTTLTDFSFYTSANDSDVQHSTSTGLLTIASPNELYIWGGDTFAPGSDVRILANATASSTDGSMYLAGNAVYNASGTLTISGSLTVISTATFTNGQFPLVFNATTTGKTINAPITSLGNVTFNGVSGVWSFTSNATTTNLTILNGTVATPSVIIGVTGTYQNDGTANIGGGSLTIVGATTPTLADFVSLTTARDASGMIASTSATSATAFAIAGNTLYIAKAGGSQGCNSTASTSAGNCEILVYNIASTTNPIFTNALDAGGSNASTSNVGVNALTVAGSMLYVAKAGSAVPCTQVAGTADGCEVMVFDISSTTNPIFRAGRDSSGAANGTSATSTTAIKVSGSALYVGKAAGATTCSATEGAGAGACEILVFNIASTTNPLYIAGLDAGGNTSAGTQPLQVNSLEVVSSTLYAVKAGSGTTTCNPTAGNAVGCELMVFNIASTTNPVLATGRDAGGSSASTSAIAMNIVIGSGTALYIGKAASAVPCTSVAGTADGCGVMVFDISSTTDPIYRRGVDGGGSYTGSQAIAINGLTLHKNYLYVAKAASAIACSQVIGLAIGCEMMVFDVASSSAIRMVAGRDAGGDSSGIQTLAINAVIGQGDALYVAKAGSGTSCAATAGNAIGCELMVFDILRPASGLLLGTMTGASTLGNVTTSGIVEFRETASTTNLSVATGTTTAPSALTVAGNYTNNATLVANEGTIYFASSTAQTIAGTLVATSSFYRAVFVGAGIKTMAANASTSFFEILSGATVISPSYLTVADTLINNGTFNANNSTLATAGYFNEFVSGVSAGGAMTDSQGLAFNNFVNAGDIVYAAKAGNGTACSQVAGSAVGCELMVFDISNPNTPIYRAGRDAAGSHASTSATSTTALAIASTTLYVAKAGGSQGCGATASTTAGNCELLVFSIASTTNPVFATALDAGGSNASTSNIGINQLVVAGTMLYVVKAASAVPCTQVAGTADGCELMVFDISSTTNPIYRAGRDASGNNTGTGNIGATSVAVSSSTLYVGKLGSATTCNPTAGSATDCELMVFDISSTTDPTFITARDSAGSNASTSAIAINSLSVSGSLLHVAKAASAIGCSQVVGSAAGCELMVFDISSTTNPTYRAGRDASGSANGTGNIAANFVAASGTNVYITKAGDTTACSQIAGSAIGCEVMMFDIGSSTNPIYIKGRDTGVDVDGRTSVAAQTILFTSNHIVVGRASDVTPCEQIKGLRIGCEMMLFKSPTTLAGTLTGTSGLATVTTNGLTKFVASASTTNLTISTSSMVMVPATELSASGDVAILGTYVPGTATFTLLGSDQRITNTATTTFYNLRQQATTSATTTFSTAGAFVVQNQLTLQGTSTARLKLRSQTTDTQWQIRPLGPSTVSYVDVQDSRNSSSTYIDCAIGCIDRGNTMNWTFATTSFGTGSTTLASHSGGQVSDAFNGQAKTDGPLLAFRLVPQTGTATVETVRLSLSGISGIVATDFSNFRLVIDRNSNRVFDGPDTIVGGAGEFVVLGTAGDLLFTSPFVATTALDYIVVADWSAPASGSFLTISLDTDGLFARDVSGVQQIFGNKLTRQHSRNNRSAGGGSASVGDTAPAGDGNVGGGGTVGGELIGNNPDFFWPSGNSGSWTTGANAYDQTDGTYATTNSVTNHNYTNLGFGVPSGNSISGIEVRLELSGSTAAGTVDVALSWDGGASWTSIKSTPTLSIPDVVYTLGSPSDLWGRSWATGEFSNANFAARVTGNVSSNTIALDALQVRVYHVTSGGGAGGGGGI